MHLERRVKTEQRRFRRVTIARKCKVFHAPSGRYWPGETSDVSAGGCLLRVDALRGLKPGQEVEVYVAWTGRCLLSASDAVPGTIRRVMRNDGGQWVGVEFKEPLAQANPAVEAA